jgi:transposase
MAFLFESGNPPYRYVYLGESFRGTDGKPNKIKARVGKFDTVLDSRVYTREFFEKDEINKIKIPKDLKKMAVDHMIKLYEKINENKEIKRQLSIYTLHHLEDCLNFIQLNCDFIEKENIKKINFDKAFFSINDLYLSNRKEFGSYYFLEQIATDIKLLDTLKDSFPGDWQELFTLACFLINTGDAMMHCQNWIEKTDCLNVNLSSPTISRLMSSINQSSVDKFYEIWAKKRNNEEILALDISSISSYSKQLGKIEFGYNREHDKLPQLNICLLFGQNSHLPVYFKSYLGSIKDVSTLRTTLSSIYNLGAEDLTLIMDKGFASAVNINALLEGPLKSNFVISLPFTMNLVKKYPKEHLDSIMKPENIIPFTENTWGTTVLEDWGKKFNLFSHIYFNYLNHNYHKFELHHKINSLLSKVKSGKTTKKEILDIERWLIKTKNEQSETIYSVNNIKLNLSVLNSGWYVLLSNFLDDKEKALQIYRAKDVVEKGFFKLKTQLDLRRLRGHSDNVVETKLLLAFIALILISYIDNTMQHTNLYRSYPTVKHLITELQKLAIININKSSFLEPLSANHKEIFKSFNINEPKIFNINL